MLFSIVGVDRSSGKTVAFDVDAPSETHAIAVAQSRGVMPTAVAPAPPIPPSQFVEVNDPDAAIPLSREPSQPQLRVRYHDGVAMALWMFGALNFVVTAIGSMVLVGNAQGGLAFITLVGGSFCSVFAFAFSRIVQYLRDVSESAREIESLLSARR